jgi:hypothetical protein
VIGLSADGRLVQFRANAPQATKEIGVVQGLSGSDTALIGIDFRVQDGKLYGVGNGGGVYTIDTETAQAQFVNALTVPLTGTSFGVDFNPAADRLRIISDTGQNLAHNVVRRDGHQWRADVHSAACRCGCGRWRHRRCVYQQRPESASDGDDPL